MRWFLACEVNEDAKRAVARHVAVLRAAMGAEAKGVRWVPREKWHVTLVFLGELPPLVARSVRAVCGEPLPLPPFSLTVAGLGVFPSRVRPRVVWVGVTDGAAAMAALRARLVDNLRAAGVERVDEGFHPHVTVGRVTRPSAALRAGLERAVRAPAVASGRTEVDHVTLFDSRVVDRGSVYDAVTRMPLCWTPNSS